jgi:hypothetical protein
VRLGEVRAIKTDFRMRSEGAQTRIMPGYEIFIDLGGERVVYLFMRRGFILSKFWYRCLE